ncbi:acetaldehyde dehydrogenase (acetylating) [Lachnospiraceae bacterium ZAX-1]
MSEKIKVGIIGTGNIGTDILLKLQRSKLLECAIFTGRNPASKGIQIAASLGINVSYDSIKAIENNPNCCDIVFDATSAAVHRYNAPILNELGKFTLDLTPARVGKMCVPVMNIDECLNVSNVNLITCGGQATVPIACALRKTCPDIKYIEIVASIASKSAGAGTRDNIDEFTQTTKDAIKEFSEVETAKAIIILNPAEPPLKMRNTVYALAKNPDMVKIRREINEVVKKVRQYVPGYHLLLEPVYENGRITTAIEVTGMGDYLPKYAGNLDIITCAAIETAEKYAEKKGKGNFQNE